MVIKDSIRALKEVFRMIIIIPFIPIALGITFFFGWVLSIGNKIPEDLDEQGKLANK